MILIIADPKPPYPKTDFTKEGKYSFDKNKDIIDVDDLVNKFRGFSPEQLEPILKFLEKEFEYHPLFFKPNQEANKDVLSEIFEYIFSNFEIEKSQTYQTNKDFTHIKKKIPLNFSIEQSSIINKVFSNYFKYEYLLREFIEAEQENPFRIDGLKMLIQTYYCEIQDISDPNEKIKDILVFEKIARKIAPKNNRITDYIFNASLIVLYFFEQCEIGMKTDEEVNEQLNLFE